MKASDRVVDTKIVQVLAIQMTEDDESVTTALYTLDGNHLVDIPGVVADEEDVRPDDDGKP